MYLSSLLNELENYIELFAYSFNLLTVSLKYAEFGCVREVIALEVPKSKEVELQRLR